MSILPLILADDLLDHPSSLFDQHFGIGIPSRDLIRERYSSLPLRTGYLRPWRHVHSSDSGLSNIVNDKDGMKVSLDVQQFKPEELQVKVSDGFLVVDGKHEERSDEHGFVSRQFTRRYKIPSNVDVNALASTLSSDGVLQLHAPKKVFFYSKHLNSIYKFYIKLTYYLKL
uniref:SHSP domain-containing protein n=1 Tax=Clastoptera arizonana TaxID=38151 RepID=A0A1B6DRN4_9HEMI